MLRSRIRKIAVAGVVLGASVSLWPATAGARHQPSCPYQHREGQAWQLQGDFTTFRARVDDRGNNNDVVCIRQAVLGGGLLHEWVRDDVIL
jgi:hypothetical protein